MRRRLYTCHDRGDRHALGRTPTRVGLASPFQPSFRHARTCSTAVRFNLGTSSTPMGETVSAPSTVTPDLFRGPGPPAPPLPGLPSAVVRGEPGPRLKAGVTGREDGAIGDGAGRCGDPRHRPHVVMPGLVPGIPVVPPPRPLRARTATPQDVDARNKSGHDDWESGAAARTATGDAGAADSASRAARSAGNPPVLMPCAQPIEIKPDTSGTSPGMTTGGRVPGIRVG